jgi:Contractile injection system tube protein/LysM domain
MSYAPSTFAKAELLVENLADPIKCWFNPTTLHVARSAGWEAKNSPSQGAPTVSYLGSREEWLTVNLLLHADGGPSARDVRGAIDQLLGLLNPAVKLRGFPRSRPPTVQFSWGEYLSFVAVADSVDVTTELFDSDGTPIRATVVLKLRQFQPELGQAPARGTNPTTRATTTHVSHTLAPGDSLRSIAYEHLGDENRWKEIAALNDIDDPTRLRAGDHLLIETGAA